MSPNQNEPDPVETLMAMPIRRAIEEHPEILPVLYNHLGASCFECPGRFEESLEKGILLHEADLERAVEDLRRALGKD